MDRNDFENLQISRLLGIDDDYGYMEYMLIMLMRIGIFSEIIPLDKEILSYLRNKQIFIFASNFHMAIFTTALPSFRMTVVRLFSNSGH